jgi:DNA (cytosine-5)-methyltransferase 1
MMAIDFFCGAGGLSKGLQMAGIEVLAGIDLDDKCSETYKKNNVPAKFVHADIRSLQPEDLFSLAPALLEKPNNFLFAGCAPCQSYSQQRKSKTPRSDATVLGDFGRLVEKCLPSLVVIENVPGIAKVKGLSIFKRFLNTLERNGYSFEWDVINAKNYGVPQNRRRLVLIASRDRKASLPPKSHGRNLLPYLTVKHAIEKFPSINAGESHAIIPNHSAAELTPINLERLENTPHNGGDRRAWPKRLLLECHKNGHKGHTDVYGRMLWDAPSPALTGRCNSISNGRYGHPVQNRAISLREAAALQTFPDDYVFYGSRISIAQQIGNAVPVLLGKVLGEHIRSLDAQGHREVIL